MTNMHNDSEVSKRTLYKNGTVLGLDDLDDKHEALVTEGANIIGVGSLDDMHSLAGKEADTVDVDGGFILPGLIDTHPHAMHFSAFSFGAVDLHDASCFDDIVKAIQERAAVTPPGDWIVCTPVGEPSYYIRRNHLDLAERRLPDRRVLDVAAPEHPVYIMADAPKIPNIVAFNSLALKKLGISRQTPSRQWAVDIEKDDDTSEPTGIMRGPVINYYSDDPFWAGICHQLPKIPDELWEYAGIAGIQKANAMGITGLYEAHAMYAPHLEAYQKLRDKGFCTARVVGAMELSSYAFSTMDYDEDEIWRNLQLGEAMTQTSDEFFRVNGVTGGRGGPLNMGYLRMYEPFQGPNGLTRGRTFISREIEKQVVKYCIDKNIRFNLVSGGYRDADDFLRTLDEVADGVDLRPREWVMQHNYFTSPAQVQDYKRHGFHVTTSASFVYGKADLVRERIGEKALRDFIAMRRFVDAGINLGCGSDWGPDNLWQQMALNETRESAHSGHKHLEYGQSLNRLQSIHAFTRNAAKIMQWENIGDLKENYKADITIVDKNPLQIPLEQLPETQVLRTIIDGVGIYDNNGLQGGPVNIRPTAGQLVQETSQ